ncbi:MAG: glyceraldehyde-3-phosphate dehydrogenase [Bacteroidia bacterium]|nr:glyceraldehyde-3-phosphate dehydrogenase [Bacteroidia bacterium]MCZ2248856.1 glyceraldehyde-3-phosphate dehydrogenase [Bacteroidia bacterium]
METLQAKSDYELKLDEWIKDEKAAIQFINVTGHLWFDKSVELILFRNQLVDRSASEILNLHQYAHNVVKQPINITDTLALAQAIDALPAIAPARIDIGRLGSEWLQQKNSGISVSDFVKKQLKDFTTSASADFAPKDVILYGFGRIGRLAARELIAQAGKGEQLRLRAIVTRSNSNEDIVKRADLLRTDSVHGPFPGTVIEDFESKSLIVNGHKIAMIAANKPEDIDYTLYGINNALLIDNTGIARDREGLGKHLKAKGVSKVLLTAPGKGDIPNIVHGVNNGSWNADENIYSAASCTTNAIVPVLKVISDKLGIERGHIETIHSYTNDQNLLDNYHAKYRRGRSAALNMVITETGADKAVAKVLPHLAGKLTGNAVRVPTPDVSLAILNLNISTSSTKEDVNEIMRSAALNGQLVEQIQYSNSNELVSTDLVGNSCASIFDSPATIVSKDGKSLVLYVWYDNEYGYTRQVIRLSKELAGVIRMRYY